MEKTKNDKLCPDGVYFYSYTGTGDNGTVFQGQGSVQIITGNIIFFEK